MATAEIQRYGRSIAHRLAEHSEMVPWCGCRIWIGSAHRYGSIRIDGKTLKAHRVAWEQERGPIPPGMNVLHKCDVPLCINVDHLFLGTQADNVADCDAKGRRGVVRGAEHVRAKVTEEIVAEIRSSGDTSAALARKFGLGETQVRRIRAGESWAHLPR